MYTNISNKIKIVAKVLFIVVTILSVISGIAIMTDEDFILSGVLTIIFGPALALVSSWLIYGFGELIEKTSKIETNTRNGAKVETKPAPASKADARVTNLNDLLNAGYIDRTEYNKRMKDLEKK